MGAFKPTVLNCFLFRQTDLILRLAVRESTTPVDFNQQRSAWKMKALFSFR
jgi:3-deoxy-D-manno-octulosonic acid (KDO) 8-phosphate synthase